MIVEGGRATIVPVLPAPSVKAQSISEAMFYEEIARRNPALPDAIKAFLAEAEPLGVYGDLKASLNLKIDLADAAKPHNLGYIAKNGQLWTDPLTATVPHDLALHYNRALADLIGGTVASGSQDRVYLSTNGKSAPLASALLPRHRTEWIDAIRSLAAQLAARQARRPE